MSKSLSRSARCTTNIKSILDKSHFYTHSFYSILCYRSTLVDKVIKSFSHIEEKIKSVGHQTLLHENEFISSKGERCHHIVFIPSETKLSVNDRVILINEGLFLNVKEYFNDESVKNSIKTLHKTHAVIIEVSQLGELEDIQHLLRLYFVMKLAKQASIFNLDFE